MRGRAWDFDALFIPDCWEAVDLIVPEVLYFKIETQFARPERVAFGQAVQPDPGQLC